MSRTNPPSPLDDASPTCRLDAAALTAGYADGSLSPVEVTIAALDRAQVVQARCNAFSHIDPDGALAMARASEARWRAGSPASAIDGVPATIKDIVWVDGWTVRYGSRAAPGVTGMGDAPSVARLRQAGAVFLGLTTTPEFGWKALTDSALTGITRNPWDLSRTPGGSSGGAAVAAASGAGVLHLGTDGGGSIRIPAAFTGTVGHKPTFGLVPAHPLSAFGTVAHIGPIARHVADAALMLRAMAGRDLRDWTQPPDPRPPALPLADLPFAGLRIGVWDRPPCGTVAPTVRAAFDRALARLSAAGAILQPVILPEHDLPGLFQTLWFAGAAARLRPIAPDRMAEIDPGLRAIAEAGARLSAVDLIEAQGRRAAFGAWFDAMLAEVDLVVSPAIGITAFEAGQEVPPGSGMARWTEWAGFSFPVNLAQAPACVVPAGLDPDGMPIGLQFIAARGADAQVLAAAATWERDFADASTS